MSGFDLREADFSQSNLIGAKFSESRADGGSFAFARCIWSFGKMASLKGSDLKNADFSGAVLAGCDFSGCNLSRAKLRAVNAVGADFSGTTLTGCDFTGADLSGAVFENAHLEGTNFSFANLEGCTFAPVDFTGGNFYKVHYDGVEPRDWPESTPPRDERVEVASIRSLERYRDNRYLLAMRLALFSSFAGHLAGSAQTAPNQPPQTPNWAPSCRRQRQPATPIPAIDRHLQPFGNELRRDRLAVVQLKNQLSSPLILP